MCRDWCWHRGSLPGYPLHAHVQARFQRSFIPPPTGMPAPLSHPGRSSLQPVLSTVLCPVSSHGRHRRLGMDGSEDPRQMLGQSGMAKTCCSLSLHARLLRAIGEHLCLHCAGKWLRTATCILVLRRGLQSAKGSLVHPGCRFVA